MYDLGQFLRTRYNKFLGTEYSDDKIYSISSDLARTKMSLQLVLAGLYPPFLSKYQKWNNDINWQPVSTNYYPLRYDHLFSSEICEE